MEILGFIAFYSLVALFFILVIAITERPHNRDDSFRSCTTAVIAILCGLFWPLALLYTLVYHLTKGNDDE